MKTLKLVYNQEHYLRRIKWTKLFLLYKQKFSSLLDLKELLIELAWDYEGFLTYSTLFRRHKVSLIIILSTILY